MNFHVASVVSLCAYGSGNIFLLTHLPTQMTGGVLLGVFVILQTPVRKVKRHSIIARFDCDLSRDCNDKVFKQTTIYHTPDVYFRQGLGGLKKKAYG